MVSADEAGEQQHRSDLDRQDVGPEEREPVVDEVLQGHEGLGASDREILKDLLKRHVEETGSPLASRLLDEGDSALDQFVLVTPTNYKAVMQTREKALAEGLDPDGDEVWSRILEVTGG